MKPPCERRPIMAFRNAYQRRISARVPFPSISVRGVHLGFINSNKKPRKAGFSEQTAGVSCFGVSTTHTYAACAVRSLFRDGRRHSFAECRQTVRIGRNCAGVPVPARSEEHTSELQSPCNLVCRL